MAKLKDQLLEVVNTTVRKWLIIEKDHRKITRSFVLGILIGMVIPVGLQSLVSFPICLFFNCNFVITIGATFITNPLTVVPIYYSALKIGGTLLGSNIPWQVLLDKFENMTVESWLSLGGDVMLAMSVGLLLQGILVAAIAHLLSKPLLTWFLSKNGTVVD